MNSNKKDFERNFWNFWKRARARAFRRIVSRTEETPFLRLSPSRPPFDLISHRCFAVDRTSRKHENRERTKRASLDEPFQPFPFVRPFRDARAPAKRPRDRPPARIMTNETTRFSCTRKRIDAINITMIFIIYFFFFSTFERRRSCSSALFSARFSTSLYSSLAVFCYGQCHIFTIYRINGAWPCTYLQNQSNKRFFFFSFFFSFN